VRCPASYNIRREGSKHEADVAIDVPVQRQHIDGLSPASDAVCRGPATVRQITVCCQKTAEFMPVTFLQLYNGTGENIMFERIKQLARKQRPPKRRTQPQPEEDLGGGDICSLQEQPSTDCLKK
jgi:hypothetical protein